MSEHGNGILKGRWQSLRGIPIRIRKPKDVEFVCDWVIGCCVLHNFVNDRQCSRDAVTIANDKEPTQQDSHDSAMPNAMLFRETMKASVLEYWT